MATKAKLYGIGPRALTPQLVAAFSGVQLDVLAFTEGLTNATPRYLQLSPSGAFPLLVTASGTALEDAAAINKELAGASTEGDKWFTWAAGLDAVTKSWVHGLLTGANPDADGEARLKAHAAELEAALAGKAFVLGDAPSAADVAIAGHFFVIYVSVFDAALQAALPNTARMLAAAYQLPQVCTSSVPG